MSVHLTYTFFQKGRDNGLRRTFTFALATRLKRRIFLAGNIPNEFLRLATEALKEEDITITKHTFYDFGVLLELSLPENTSPDSVATLIRESTSKPLRITFSELWPLPSLWTKKCLIRQGELDENFIREADEFYASLKSR